MSLHRVLPALVAAALFLPGCERPTGDIRGTVTRKGKASAVVVTGLVTLIRDDSSKLHFGRIQPDGTYEIKGAPIGVAKMTVESPRPDAKSDDTDDPVKLAYDPKKWFPIHEKYQLAEATPLQFEVKAGPNTFNIEVELGELRPDD